MIIENGTIRFKEKTPAAFDPKTGYPAKPGEAKWGDPIPCQFIPVSQRLLMRSNGEHVSKATYTVLIEEQTLPESEQLRLADRDGREMGDFSLLAPPEPLEAVGEIRILI